MDFWGISISLLYSEKGTEPAGRAGLQTCNGCSSRAPLGNASAVLGAAQLQELSHILVPLQPASVSFFLSHCSVDDTTLITDLFLQCPNKLNVMNIMVNTFFLLEKKSHNEV